MPEGLENEFQDAAERLAALKVEEALKDPAIVAAAVRELGHDDLALELEVRHGLAPAPEPAAEALGSDAELVDQAKSAFAALGYRPVGR
jgi:hypothetical protein